jgi:hypothetical protein
MDKECAKNAHLLCKSGRLSCTKPRRNGKAFKIAAIREKRCLQLLHRHHIGRIATSDIPSLDCCLGANYDRGLLIKPHPVGT